MIVYKRLGPNNRSLVLTGLKAHSVYQVEIAGVTDVGVGVAQTIFTGIASFLEKLLLHCGSMFEICSNISLETI